MNPSPVQTDIGKVIDDAPLRFYHLQIFLICYLTSMVDGLDVQMVGFSAAAIAGDLGIPLASFGAIFSASAAGALVGALGLGTIADKIGRKRSLVICTAIFAALTFAALWARTATDLTILRFLAGIGLGGALPCIFTLVSEYAPRRRRALAAGLLWTGYPLGGMAGAAAGSLLIPAFGWQSVFVMGGALAAAVALLQWLLLPDSAQFLALNPANRARVGAIARRIDLTVAADAVFVAPPQAAEIRAPVKALFAGGMLPVTLLIWAPTFCTFLITNFFVLWMPPLLQRAGYGISLAAGMVALTNLAAIPSQAASGYLMDRRDPFQVITVSYIALALAIAILAVVLKVSPVVGAMMFAIGLLQGPGIAGMMHIATRIYAPAMRSTGVGWALGVSRTGQILGSLAVGSAVKAQVAVPLILAAVSLVAVAALLSALLLRRKVRALPDRYPDLQATRP